MTVQSDELSARWGLIFARKHKALAPNDLYPNLNKQASPYPLGESLGKVHGYQCVPYPLRYYNSHLVGSMMLTFIDCCTKNDAKLSATCLCSIHSKEPWNSTILTLLLSYSVTDASPEGRSRVLREKETFVSNMSAPFSRWQHSCRQVNTSQHSSAAT